MEVVKKNLAASEGKAVETEKTVVQLRKIGRKYRMQAEDTQKKLDEERTKNQQAKIQDQLNAITNKLTAKEAELKAYNDKFTAKEAELKASNDKLLAAEQKVKSTEESLALITENLGSAEYEKNEANKHIKELEARIKAITENTTKLQRVNIFISSGNKG